MLNDASGSYVASILTLAASALLAPLLLLLMPAAAAYDRRHFSPEPVTVTKL